MYYYSSDGGTTYANDATHCTGTEAENVADANCKKIKASLTSSTGGVDTLADHGSDYSIDTCAHWCESLDGCFGYLFNKDEATDSTYCHALGKVPEETCSPMIGHAFMDEPCMLQTDHPDFDEDKTHYKTEVCVDDVKAYSQEMCESYKAALAAEAALLAAEKSCDPLLNCFDATPDDTEDDLCHKDTSGGDMDGKYYCTLIGSTADVSNCPDVIQDPVLTNMFRSYAICEAVGASKAAAEAEAAAAQAAIDAAKTCSPSVNCDDPPAGEHACQLDESGAEPRYYCTLKTGQELVDTEGVNAALATYGADTATSCADVAMAGQDSVDADGNVIYNYRSYEVCDAYAALVASGLTCVQETDCEEVSGEKCALDTTDDKYKCKVSGLADTACTDVETYKKLVSAATVNPAVGDTYQYTENDGAYCSGTNWWIDGANGAAATGDYPSKRAGTVAECKRICDLQADCIGISHIEDGHAQNDGTPCIICTSTDVTRKELPTMMVLLRLPTTMLYMTISLLKSVIRSQPRKQLKWQHWTQLRHVLHLLTVKTQQTAMLVKYV